MAQGESQRKTQEKQPDSAPLLPVVPRASQRSSLVIATCREFYHVEQRCARSVDDAALCSLLQHLLGTKVEAIPWDGEHYDWTQTQAVVLRSTYYYHLRPRQFLAWAQQMARQTTLLNPLEVIRWNLEKAHYLRALESHGIPIIPTLVLTPEEPWDLVHVLEEQGWQQAVLKPSIGANSYATRLVDARDTQALRHVQATLPAEAVGQTFLLQPYVEEVATRGEINYVFAG
ncbi:hypothetical protein EPA93_45210 [Ktedonosporobacter rubrisoli]|uniref:Prokaryotic glutathione synthetase ATP-binding domain-containing protein n=1 Tax=Ktedonosporobacter rubrisoli TaxID=2509675 RepID=A0A4P6K407_KTERU|nr:hypothetical protein [Ktedonosporobacter rubrisoli]QBD82785.1 hypothetical protein EPA93_45210 [Ktedonosporobacter rubrisoli]